MTVVHPAQFVPERLPKPGEQSFTYAPGLLMLIAGVIFFTACGLGMSHTAATNDQGLIIDGFIRLSPDHAGTFYLVVAGASFAFVMVLLFYTLPQRFISRQIILHADSITLPGSGFDAAHYQFSSAEIVSFKITVVKNRRFLKIYAGERSFSVNPTWLGEPGAFEEIVGWLAGHSQSRLC